MMENQPRRQIYWTLFIYALSIPLLLSVVSPLSVAFYLPVLGLIFFIGHRLVLGEWASGAFPVKGFLPLIIGLSVLCLSSSLWSVQPSVSLERAEKTVPLILLSSLILPVALRCPPSVWQKAKIIFPISATFLAAAIALDIFFDMPFLRFLTELTGSDASIRADLLNKNASVFFMALPVCAYLAFRGRSVLLTALLFAFALMLFLMTNSQASQMAFMMTGLLAFGCLSFLEKLTIRSAFLTLGFLLLTMPWISPTLFDLLASRIAHAGGMFSKASAALRLENWDFISRRIQENPATGFGMDSTREMTFDTQKLYFPSSRIMHPHNIALQIWIEFGAMGCVWGLLFFGWLYALLVRLTPTARRLGFITFGTIMVFLLLSWSIWSGWLIAIIFYLTALTVLAAKTSISPSPA